MARIRKSDLPEVVVAKLRSAGPEGFSSEQSKEILRKIRKESRKAEAAKAPPKGKFLKGQSGNPKGRCGKSGVYAPSLKDRYKAFLERLPPSELDKIWAGLLAKASEGDVNATKLLLSLNGERVEDAPPPGGMAGATIVISVPQLDG